LKRLDLLCDVGAEFNPETKRFDHHQKSFNHHWWEEKDK
jgi:uncharacterized UPF0160 family protein